MQRILMSKDPSSSNNKFEQYINDIQSNLTTKTGKPKKLSDVKRLILYTLWNAGTSFPRDWVSSQQLNELTKQKYFDRRVRELRDQNGCDIETGFNEGSHAYRLYSDTMSAAFDRTYLTNKQRTKLFETHHFSCAACGQKFSAEDASGLQADHKVPLIKGGGSELANWQPLCVSCNVAKRRSCQGCDIDCKICAWVFPEKFGQTFSIQLQQDTGLKLQEIARQRSVTPHFLIVKAVHKFVNDQLPDSEL